MNSRRNSKTIKTKDYRHTNEKRKNVPPAKLADEGQIPKMKKVRYYYSPHLSPELRFDPEGKADRVLAIKEKAGKYLTPEEKGLLDHALSSQQPWLEWAGKKEQFDRSWFEVDPVALHIHERVSAQAIVRAASREELQRDLFADPQLPYQKEVQFYQHDVDWANRLILGDSLQVMSSLARRENLAGKVQTIYVDPPYGIKFASNFQSQLGKRQVGDKVSDMTRQAEVVKAYRDTWVLGVHSYLSYLRERLVIAKDLLKDTGSIFVQISDQNSHLVRDLLDEIFGDKNFCGQIHFRSTTSQTSEFLASVGDYIIWYAKDHERVKYRQLYNDKNTTDPTYILKYAEYLNGERRTIESSSRNSFDASQERARLFVLDNLTSQSGGDTTKISFEYQGEHFIPGPGFWKTNENGLQRLKKAQRLGISGNTLRYIRYADDFPVTPIVSWWLDTSTGSFTESKVFVVQTNAKVISRCILMTTDPGDLVLDPTCGSGTTAYVAEQWGRRWITIDTSRVAIGLARQRLLTARYDYFKLLDKLSIDNGFFYKTVPHITLRSIAQNQNLDPIFEKYDFILKDCLQYCNMALKSISEDKRNSLQRKLLQKRLNEGKRAITDADQRRWDIPFYGQEWQEWQVPFDTDPEWPSELQDAVLAYRKAWRNKMDEVNACIVANAEQEKLVDQPEVEKSVVRVSGPFTVEGIRPEELSLSDEGLFDGTPNEWEQADIADEIQNLSAYLSRMVELIRKDGITFPNNKHQIFGRVDPLYQESTGTPIHAEAIWNDIDIKEANNIGISFGPQYGPVTVEQVAEVIRSGRRYDELIIAGFSFDAAALDALQESQHPKQKIHIAHIRPDVSPGMDGLLKETPNSQLFTVFGQPEIKVHPQKSGEYTVELLGVDIYDPLTGEVRSSKADLVAAWFLDSDYDGRCFCITQAFFPDQNAWEKIAKSLGSQADPDAFAALNGTVSLPFKSGKFNRIAVKVIDPRGNEVIAIAKLEKEAK